MHLYKYLKKRIIAVNQPVMTIDLPATFKNIDALQMCNKARTPFFLLHIMHLLKLKTMYFLCEHSIPVVIVLDANSQRPG